MCGTKDALYKLIDTALDGAITKTTLSGWASQSNTYRGGNVSENQFISASGILAGGIQVSPGGLDQGGFRFDMDPTTKDALTIERIRGVLVTTLGVAATDETKEIVTAFAKVTEALTTQCFHPTRFELTIDAQRDPFLSVSFSNGLLQVTLETAEQSLVGGVDLDLQLDTRFLVGSRCASILAGKTDYSFSGTGLCVEKEGKFEQVMSVTTYTQTDDESTRKANTPMPEQPTAETLFPETEQGLLNRKVYTAVVKQLARVVPTGVSVSAINMSRYHRTGNDAVTITLVTGDFKRTYALDFRG